MYYTDIEWFLGLIINKRPPCRRAASEAAHEARIAGILGLKPGTRALDVGCGVGGPMRTIASTSGGHVTGVTINDYQVKRAKYHNQRVSGPRGSAIRRAPLAVFACCQPTRSTTYSRHPVCATGRLRL